MAATQQLIPYHLITGEPKVDNATELLTRAYELLLEQQTVQTNATYSLDKLADEIDSGVSGNYAYCKAAGKNCINHADIAFGISTALKQSADNAELLAQEIITFVHSDNIS